MSSSSISAAATRGSVRRWPAISRCSFFESVPLLALCGTFGLKIAVQAHELSPSLGIRFRQADEAAFSVELVPIVANGPSYQGWKVHGTVRKPIVFMPQTLRINNADGHSEEPMIVSVRSQVPLNNYTADAQKRLFSAIEILPDNQSPNKYRMSVQVSDPLPIGEHYTEIVLTTRSPSGQTVAGQLPVILTVSEPVLVSPKEVSFGAVGRDMPHHETILLRALNGDRSFRVIKVLDTDSARATVSTGDGFASSHSVIIEAVYNTLGNHAGSIEIVTEDASNRQFRATVPVRAYVVETDQ